MSNIKTSLVKEPTKAEILKVAKTLGIRPWAKQSGADKDHYLAQARLRLLGRFNW